MTVFIALLRAINVGKRQVPMAELRALCAEIGLKDAQTYIQSGNIVFEAADERSAIEARLEAALAARFGFEVDVIMRSAAQWSALISANPLPGPSAAEPNRVMMMLSKSTPSANAAELLEQAAAADEKMRVAGDAIWGHFPAGLGTSLLTPNLINKAAGSPTTARNWRTVLKLQEMIEARG